MLARIKRYFVIAAGFFLFAGVYASVPADHRQVAMYLLIPLGLCLSFTVPAAAVFIHGAGLILFLFTTNSYNLLTVSGMAALLIGTSMIPLYFDRVRRKELESFRERCHPKEEHLHALEGSVAALKEERQNFEKEIERINQLYVLGRELVEHMNTDAVIEHLQRVLLKRPGIRSVAIFSWERKKWNPLYFSRPECRDRWLAYMQSQASVGMEAEFRLLPTPEWIGEQAIVYWPVRLEKELLAAIFLTTEVKAASRYLEEGAIFVPQIALGMLRTRLFAEVSERSRTDGLTGLYRRGYFLERMQAEIKRAERYKSAFSFLMLDIDHFKRVNDTYGHLAGDEVLRTMASTLQGCVRPGDMVGRYGGEEFFVLLPMASPVEAMEIAQEFRRGAAACRFPAAGGTFCVTVSIGISHYPADAHAAERIISTADQALYWVKEHGRDGVKEYASLTRGDDAGSRTRPGTPLPPGQP